MNALLQRTYASACEKASEHAAGEADGVTAPSQPGDGANADAKEDTEPSGRKSERISARLGDECAKCRTQRI